MFRSSAPKYPPQTIISKPVHTDVCFRLAVGTPAPVDVAVQPSVSGLYRPPVFSYALPVPLQTTISDPVHAAEWYALAVGTPAPTEVATQLSVAGR